MIADKVLGDIAGALMLFLIITLVIWFIRDEL